MINAELSYAELPTLDPRTISIIATNYANVAGEYFEGTFGEPFENDQVVTLAVSGAFRYIRN